MGTATLTPTDAVQWLALRMVPGLGTRSVFRILEQFKTPARIFEASASELQAAGLTPAQARHVATGCSFEDAVEQQERLVAAGATLITLHDKAYPSRLLDIFDPPILMFAIGRTELLCTHGLAVVGTRRPTPYGVAATERLSADLAQAGLTIVSGMARGIDTAAHRAALETGGNTIAVLGCGVDVLYPSENRKLYNEIGQRGLLLSEFPMGAPAYPQNFPIRNRIISGVSAGVLIVEGAQHSGSAITAKLAVDQGRDVFAVPGNITSKMSWGPNLLIKDGGAKLVQEWTDVTNELSPAIRRDLVSRAQQRTLVEFPDQPAEAGAPEAESTPQTVLSNRILKFLQVDECKQLETLLESFNRSSTSEMIGALFDLEMSGLIRQLPGKNFVRVW